MNNNNNDIITKYSNGYGHLAVTLGVLICVTIMLCLKAIPVDAAIGLATPAIAFWFLSGAASRFEKEPLAPAPTFNQPAQPAPAQVTTQVQFPAPSVSYVPVSQAIPQRPQLISMPSIDPNATQPLKAVQNGQNH